MGRFREVQAFVREAGKSTKLEDLYSLMEGTVHALGFDYFALGHHVNVTSNNQVQIGNYPSAWMETLHERAYIFDDPVLMACQTTAAGFRWDEVPNMINVTKRQENILRCASKAGMGDGFTVPIHIPGECAGSCSFAVRTGRELDEEVLPSAQYVGCFAFEAARRLVRKSGSQRRRDDTAQPPTLTNRQLDCVVLVAQGKSDGDVAQLLGISADTVHQHIEAAKQRFGVATRTQLVVRTLFDNQLAFQDVMSW